MSGQDDDFPPVHLREPQEFASGERLPAWFACNRHLDHRRLIAREEWAYCIACRRRVPYHRVVDRRDGEVNASAPAYL